MSFSSPCVYYKKRLQQMFLSFSIASLDFTHLIALWLVFMGRSLSLNRTIFKLYGYIYNQVKSED